MKQKAAFLFGCGISYATQGTKIKGVKELTDAVLNGAWKINTFDKWNNDSSEKNGVFIRSSAGADITSLSIQHYLLYIFNKIRDYHTFITNEYAQYSNEPNYEDLFEIVDKLEQIGDTESSLDYAILELYKDVRSKYNAADSFEIDYKTSHDDVPTKGFRALNIAASIFINSVVYHELCTDGKRPIGLELLRDALGVLQKADIFTINHDLLIEQLLDEAHIRYFTGFETPTRKGSDPRFMNDWPDEKENEFNLFKLHGSLDWFSCEQNSGSGKVKLIARTLGDGTDYKIMRDDKINPYFLTGTIVKATHYQEIMFEDLFHEFKYRLTNYKHLICCGYGFGDSGINYRINQWLHDNTANRLVILTKGVKDDYAKHRLDWISYFYKNKQIIIIDHWFSDCPLADLNQYFDSIG